MFSLLGSLSISRAGTPNSKEMSSKKNKKAAALWQTHSAVAKGTCVTRYNAYHTNKNNKANNTQCVLYRVIHTTVALDV